MNNVIPKISVDKNEKSEIILNNNATDNKKIIVL